MQKLFAIRQPMAIATMALLLSFTFTSFTSANAGSPNDAKVIASFLDHLKSSDVTDATKKAAQQKVDELVAQESPIDAITEGLIEVFPDYAKAVESADSDNPDEAIKLLGPLSESEDKFLAADASFYLARTLMNSERFEEAIPKLEKLQGDLQDFSIHSGVTEYFMGLAQAGMLNNEAAIKSFVSFLQSNPDAPERMRVSAWRQAQRLQGITDGELNDVHQRMDFSRRRLELDETSDSTQDQQEEIVKKLTLLIKKEEKKESSQSAKNTKKPSEKPQAKEQQQAKKQSQPQKKNQSKQAGKSNVQNGKAVVKNYDDSPASAWSRLRERSRDPANNAIKEKLPAKYRDLVEKYMEKANGGSDNN
jgi:tetratricopeptide (TPR) repeat protein